MTPPALCTVWLAIAVAAFGCDRGKHATPPPVRIDEPPEKTLEELARAPHGLYKLSRENRIRLDQIRSDSAPYLAVIRREYPRGAVARLARDQSAANDFTMAATNFMMAAAVLGVIDSPAAADVLAPWYVELDDALLVERDSRALAMLERIQGEVLGALRGHPRDVVLNRILGRFQQMDRAKRLRCLRYLADSSQGNAEVIQRLRAFHDAPESRLYGDPDLAKVIPRPSGDRRAPDGGSDGR